MTVCAFLPVLVSRAEIAPPVVAREASRQAWLRRHGRSTLSTVNGG
jgi:hypothetical protein